MLNMVSHAPPSLVTRVLANVQYLLAGRPAEKLHFIAITGSAGKSTAAHLIHHILQANGKNVGIISSQGVYAWDKMVANTPVDKMSPASFFAALKSLVDQKVETVVVECPAKSIADGLFVPLKFDSAVLTSVIADGLSNDEKWAQTYAEILFSPFTQVKDGGLAVVNAEDENINWINARAEKLPQKLYASWCSFDQIESLETRLDGSSFVVDNTRFTTSLIGSLNLVNLLLAIRYAMQIIPISKMPESIATFPGLPGRLQLVQQTPVPVIIDSVVRPDVLNDTLQMMSTLKSQAARLVCVMGCDHPHDAHIGSTLARFAKIVVLVPQNPGNQDLSKLASLVVKAGEQRNAVLIERFHHVDEYNLVNKENLFKKVDRVIANGDVVFISFEEQSPTSRSSGIGLALSLARAGDIVYVGGKGHDDQLAVGESTYEWHEVDLVKQLIKQTAKV